MTKSFLPQFDAVRLSNGGFQTLLIAEIEFRGIQKFVFASPRLRDMVGANVLIGETIRRHLVALAVRHHAVPIVIPAGVINGPIHDDPIKEVEDIDIDDPAALYAKGILSRDGGHLRVCMAAGAASDAEQSNARAFLAAAADLLQTEVPGLRHDLRLIAVDDAGNDTTVVEGDVRPELREVILVASPYFALCSATGTDRATRYWPTPEGLREPVSASVHARRTAYDRWRNKDAGDIISLMDRWMGGEEARYPGETAPDLLKMCGNDYMAVIHADGNNVGDRAVAEAKKIKVTDRASFLRKEAAFENFHHRNRVNLRKAVTQALAVAFGVAPVSDSASAEGSFRQFQLLMLGGDDLLLICRAKGAMQFVTSLCDALAKPGDADPLTLGIGIAIASPNLPIHRLVELSDDLAASAKRLFRRLDAGGTPASVVDWHIETGSWTPEISSHRRKTELVSYGTETCALIQRPLRVLEDADPAVAAPLPPQLDRLAGLLRASAAVQEGARNKLRKMSSALSLGRRSAEAKFQDLPVDLLCLLRDPAKVGLVELWRAPAAGHWVTPLRDLVELSEIAKLATNKPVNPVGASR